MKKYLKFFVVPILAVGLFACQFACQVEEVIATGLAPGLVKLLGCPATALPVVQATVQSDINLGNLCVVTKKCQEKELKAGMIANAVCPLVAATATATLGNVIPPSWTAAGCQPAAGGLGMAVDATCRLLPL